MLFSLFTPVSRHTMTRWLLSLSLFLLVPPVSAQASIGDPCSVTLAWLAGTFEANDAGYAGVVSRKGGAAYEELLDGLAERAEDAVDGPACHAVLLDYVSWFRRGHVGVRYVAPTAPEPSGDALRDRYAGAWAVDLDALRAQLADATAARTGEAQTLEGVWTNGTYEVAVVRADTAGAERYLGVILASANPSWEAGQVKFELTPEGAPDGRSGTLWMGDHSALALSSVDRIGDDALDLLPVDTYTRVGTSGAVDPAAEVYLADRRAPGPVFRQLSDRTAYLRVPSFAGTQKVAIDSLLAAHHGSLTSTPGLVIDLRGNGGGSDASYAQLLELLYTTPIRQVRAEFRSTPLNNARNDSLLADPEMPEAVKAWARGLAARLAETDAEWVPAADERVTVLRLDTVYANPQRVVVLTDEGNGSTTEQFLLDARQSFKVKTAGARTAGVLDVSNVNVVSSPDGRYELAYSLSRSYRVPEMAIDDVGLAPDVYFDASVPRWQWVEHARQMIEGE